MTGPAGDALGRALGLAPVVFIIHVLEESPTFVPWFNAHVTPGITRSAFWNVNVTGLSITGVVAVGFWLTRSPSALGLAVAWLSFLMLTNAIFHIAGAVLDAAYVPGLLSAIVLYLPYFVWVLVRVLRSQALRPVVVAAAIVVGGLPMAVHGYRILFLGTRLF
jgi:hypothetical protein